MLKVNSLLLLVIVYSQNFDPADVASHGANFDCIQHTESGNSWECCGIVANGERHCAPAAEWSEYQGAFRRCDTNLNTAKNDGKDLCCDSSLIQNCGVCKSFFIWEFSTYDEMNNSEKTTFDEDWKDTYLDQDLSDRDAYDNQVYPGGFAHGTLKEFNEPPVCVYIPGAAGSSIEIKVEPDEQGDRLCVSDLEDDINGKNDPGQITTCDDLRLSTCFPDGSLDTEKNGFAFYIFCDESCEEGGDVMLWFRARYSDTKWTDENANSSDGVEMWCEYVPGTYPEYDVFPSEIAPEQPEMEFDPNSSSSLVVLFIVLSVCLLF